jgi:hypothetical protein
MRCDRFANALVDRSFHAFAAQNPANGANVCERLAGDAPREHFIDLAYGVSGIVLHRVKQ